ncbi:MAG: 3-deoxy-D-manno-octulosonic acid kinase [Gammaproteobacteria bacterium]|nr:3-deoxy-D-manno-octulosonic acid kinase [Gammaproteobacteria bacterium]
MKQYKIEKLGQRWVLFDTELMTQPKNEYFSCAAMRNLVTGTADGRGETCFYTAGEKTWALRHYLRGGLIARLLRDQYFGLRLKNTRAWKEWQLLNDMRALGLPVPKPVAASVIKNGVFYRADLITEYLPNTLTLSDMLVSKKAGNEIWQTVGQTIRQFHNHSVFHSDLNAKNILIGEQEQIYLIDFDQCGFRRGDDWKQSNLLRLKRSLNKLKSKSETFYFSETDWDILLQAYETEK